MPRRIVKTADDCDYIPIEYLCYVLEPERLSLPITGEPYTPFNAEEAGDLEIRKHEMFRNRCQLADYFVSQLRLFVKMAKGRSYNVISWFTKKGNGFSYIMLIGMSSNPHLPLVVRTEAIYLILVLYVDRYPQLSRAGKPSLPEKLWYFDNTQETASISHAVRKIQAVSLTDGLPVFSLSRENIFSNDWIAIFTNSLQYLLNKFYKLFLW